MSDFTYHKEVLVGPHIVRLLLRNENPFVEFERQIFSHVWLLSQQLNLLSDSIYLKEFAEIANFLWKGLQFKFIENIQEYQNYYIQQIDLEKKFPTDIFPCRLTDYQIFDVSVMHHPILDEGQLLFFVYQESTNLPYRVVCPFPYISSSTLVHYQVLPIKTQALS